MHMKYRDYPVGTLIEMDGTRLEVVKTRFNIPTCNGCFFSDYYRIKHKMKRVDCCDYGMVCTSHMRQDHNHIIFKEVDI